MHIDNQSHKKIFIYFKGIFITFFELIYNLAACFGNFIYSDNLFTQAISNLTLIIQINNRPKNQSSGQNPQTP